MYFIYACKARQIIVRKINAPEEIHLYFHHNLTFEDSFCAQLKQTPGEISQLNFSLSMGNL